jgi:hypothetical protein
MTSKALCVGLSAVGGHPRFYRGYAEGSSKIAHKVLLFLWDNECYLTDQNSAIFNIFNNSSYFNYYDYLLYYKYEKGK